MRFAFLIENYHGFYSRFLDEHPEVARQSYDEMLATLLAQDFYYGDSYARGLRALGHEAVQIMPHVGQLQKKWAGEHGLELPWQTRRPWCWYWTKLKRTTPPAQRDWWQTILLSQLDEAQPDVVFVFSGIHMTLALLQEIRKRARVLICHWSCPLQNDYPYRHFDLIVSSAPHLVEHFRGLGIQSVLLRHGFDETILSRLGPPQSRTGLLFLGSLSPAHSRRIQLLDFLSRHLEFDFYGMGVEHLPADSPLRKRYRGPVFGIEMYRVLSRYRMCLHTQIDMSADFAGAKRLFEVTGVGTMLLSDGLKDLGEMFEIGKEVVTYRDNEDCLRKIRYHLEHVAECERIAAAGQKRTLREHTIRRRMEDLAQVVETSELVSSR